MTPQQAAVVNCEDRLVIVEANAGAAKTTTLAMRVERALSTGVSPAKVLALAYTEAGREALLKALLAVGIHPTIARQVRICTFDEFATLRLRALQGATGRPRSPERVRPYVLEAIRLAREAAQARHPDEFHIAGDGELAVEGLLRASRQIKGSMAMENLSEEFLLTPSSAREVIGWDYTTLMVTRASERLRCGGLWRDTDVPLFRYLDDATFDLAVMLGSALAPFDDDNHPLTLGLALIVVDEMHDLNRAMCTVLRGLLERNPQARFVGVGDIDQVIHSEAAADPYFMGQGFDIEVGRATRLPLDTSYRFSMDVARVLSLHAGKPYRARHDRATMVETLVLDSGRDLREFLRDALAGRRGLQPRSSHDELAVLLRHPSRYVALENELLDHGIDYITCGFESYLRRPEVLFVRAVLACALGQLEHIESDDVRRQMIYSLMLFAGVSVRSSMDGVRDEAVAQEWEGIAKLTTGSQFVVHTLPRLLEQMPQPASFRMQKAMAVARSDDVDALIQAIAVLDVEWFASRVLVHAADVDAAKASVQGVAAAGRKFDSISALLRGMNQWEMAFGHMKRKRTAIRLSTIEAAKGLEFDHVVMPDVNAGEFDGGDPDDRNLFYVGASRAKHLLTLAHKTGKPSRFLGAVSAP